LKILEIFGIFLGFIAIIYIGYILGRSFEALLVLISILQSYIDRYSEWHAIRVVFYNYMPIAIGEYGE